MLLEATISNLFHVEQSLVPTYSAVERKAENREQFLRIEQTQWYQVDAPTTGRLFVPTRRRRRSEFGT